jgi:hypothetical protein
MPNRKPNRPTPLQLLALFDGNREEEFEARFEADYAGYRDWFQYSAAIRAFLVQEGFTQLPRVRED